MRSGITHLLLAVLLAFAIQPAMALPAPAADVPETKAPEFFKLKNEDLLKQAQAIFVKADGDYRAQLRELATAEQLLADARRQLADLKVPPAPSATQPLAPRAAVELAKSRQTVLAQKLKLAQAQKTMLDRVAAASDSCQTVETAYLNAIDDLRAYAMEISLRVRDASLPADQSPAGLSEEALGLKRREVLTKRDDRQARAARMVKEQEAVTRSLEDAAKAVLAVEAELAQASRVLAQEEKAQQVTKQYAGKQPADLAAELSALAEEGIGLKGTFELGLARFEAAAVEADRLRKAVDSLKQPDVKIPQLARPEDIEQAAKGTQTLIDFFGARVKALEQLKTALAAVLRIGADFNADATVSTEHLFKMRIIAEVLKKSSAAGLHLPPEAEPDRVLAAEQRETQQVTSAQAAIDRARADGPQVDKQLTETRANADNAIAQLASLKQSQGGMLAALAWEAKLKEMTSDQAVESFNTVSKSLQEKFAAMEKQQAEHKAALTAATELRAKLSGLKDPFLRAAEEAGQSQEAQILGELRKEAGLDRAAAAAAPASAPAAPADAAKPTDPDKKPATIVVEKKPELTAMEKAVASLQAFQQLVSGRLRVLEDRDIVSKDLLNAIASLEKVDAAYGKALADAQSLALQLHATAVNLKKRVGIGEFAGAKAPTGLADALRPELLAKLDADTAALLTAESQFKQEKESLQKPDPAAQAGKDLTRDVLTLVGQRLDLLSDLRRLDATYKLSDKDRDPGEIKRMEQEADERQYSESSFADAILSLDTSKRGKALSELLESDYRELIDLELRENNLRQQRQKAEKLVELSQKEQETIAKAQPVFEKQIAELEAARDEESVLAKARLKGGDDADELLKAYAAKTGRLLSKPVPLGEKDKARSVAELAGAIFGKTVQAAAARNWIAALSARLAATGVNAEAGVFQDEVARINAVSGANGRRIEAITGTRPPEPSSKEAAAIAARQVFHGTGGSIARTRDELTRVRSHGVMIISLKILAIAIVAFMLPRLIRPLIHRSMRRRGQDDEHGNAALVLGAVQVFIKTAVWITAIAMVLNVLGFDITAIIAGLGIGGLAIGLAAQPMISDVISAVIIFVERKFTIGDVIRIGADEPAKVVGLSWRGTQLKGRDGLVINVPNRNITAATIQNLTRDGRTFDSLNVTVTTQKDVGKVLALIQQATAECKYLAAESGWVVREYEHKGNTRIIKYQFWWYLRDYDVRNRTRDEVFSRISERLASEDMAGTDVTLA